MKIPLTLAIIPALIVTSGGDRYAIPQVSLLELVRLEGEQAQRGIEQIHGAPVYRLRGNLLPLVYLDRAAAGRVAPRADDGEVNIVVLQADDRQFGLVVDAIHDTEEIVVKPLQKQLKGISVFAGATIMGDGRVALILDVLGLAQRANVVSGVRERGLAREIGRRRRAGRRPPDRAAVRHARRRPHGHPAVAGGPAGGVPALGPGAGRAAGRGPVPRRDPAADRRVAGTAPPARLAQDGRPARRGERPRPGADDGETVQVVVYAGKGRRVGLVVDRILDIVEETLGSRSRANRPGVLFTAVVQGRVTEFLDVEGIIRSADPDFFEQPQTVAAEA